MSVRYARQRDREGWVVGPTIGDVDYGEFDGITAQLLAIILGWADPVSES